MKMTPLPRARALIPAALAACAAAFAIGSACSNNLPNNTGGDFTTPTALAVATAVDRDLLFVANAGSSDLRAINICNTPTNDAGVAITTCAAEQDYHFVPGPIRVFPGSFSVGNRPFRLAGVRLLAPDGGTVTTAPDGGNIAPVGGAVLVGGAEPALYVVDANTIRDSEYGVQKTLPPPARIALPAQAVDVIAQDLPASIARIFAITAGEAPGQAQLFAFSATLGPSGAYVPPTPDAKCTLPIVPTRLALIPNQIDKLYVADGSPNGVPGGVGDGALEYNVADLLAAGNAGGPCPPARRIAATDNYSNPPRARPLTALALNPPLVIDNPASVDNAGNFSCPDGSAPVGPANLCDTVLIPAGAMILGVTGSAGVAPDPTDPNAGREAGRLIFLRTATGGVAPRPPADFSDEAAPPMEPLAVNGLAREVAFMIPPGHDKCPFDNQLGAIHNSLPCQLLVVGNQQSYERLVATATSSDGATYFIQADRRRFYNDARAITGNSLGPLPAIETQPSFTGVAQPGKVLPSLTLAPEQLVYGDNPQTRIPAGGMTAGVSRHSTWRATFHAPIPGLERRGARLTVVSRNPDSSPADTRLDIPGIDLTTFTSLAASCGKPGKYCLGLGAGDFVSFHTFQPAPGTSLCQYLTDENTQPPREFPIAPNGISASSLELGPEQTGATARDLFNPPAECLPAYLTVEVRTGGGVGNRPWLVFQGNEVRGRVGFDEQFVGYEPRFDYPLEAPTLDGGTVLPDGGAVDPTKVYEQDVGTSFTITCNGDPACDAPLPEGSFFYTISSGQAQTSVRDTGALPGLGGPVLVYNSPKVTNLIFTAITGSNSVLQISPGQIGLIGGIIAYR
jgi:hypothetical protein